MDDVLKLGKFTLVITTRCNLRCKLCCEYVPQNKPFPDMTLDEEKRILSAFFDTVDSVNTLHLSGGGEPFLHKDLPAMIDAAFEYEEKFDRFMVFTNSTVPVSDILLDALVRHKNKTVVHASDYGLKPELTESIYKKLRNSGVNLRTIKYYGEEQDFGGWVDFGEYKQYKRSDSELADIFQGCAVTKAMGGNWRTRDGKMHWCSRSQRGLELGLLPNFKEDYVDLLDESKTRDEKRALIRAIEQTPFLKACDWCAGVQGTTDESKRFKAAEQIQ